MNLKSRKRALNLILTAIIVLLFASSSSLIINSNAAIASNVNCKINVCAYVSEVEAVVVISGTKIVKLVENTNLTACCQEGWDNITGMVIVPGYSSALIINASTNKIFKQVYSSTFNFPEGALYNPVTNVVLVTNSGSDTLTVINATTWKAESKTITVGDGQEEPSFLAYNPANKEIYVSLRTRDFQYCGDNVTVLSASTDKVIKVISVGYCPAGIAFNPTNNETYVGNEGSATVSVISLANKVIKTITLHNSASPWGLNYGNGNIYVCDRQLFGNNAIYIISSTNKFREISGFSGNPIAAAYDPVNRYEYVVAFSTGQVQLLIGTKISFHRFNLNDGPSGIITTASLP